LKASERSWKRSFERRGVSDREKPSRERYCICEKVSNRVRGKKRNTKIPLKKFSEERVQ
jgi:hypothetical protein